MTKRLSSKLLAVILTLAICATTVLGCLITAYAVDNSVYKFGTPVFAEDLKSATIDVTFTAPGNMPNGFTAGEFTLSEVDKNNDDCLTFTSVTSNSESFDVTSNGSKYTITGSAANSTTLTVTLGFSKGEATKGKVYKLKLTDVNLSFNDTENTTSVNQTADGDIAKISATCQHEIAVVGDPVATGVGGDYGYAVYQTSKCTICGEQFGYQLVPTTENVSLATEEDKLEGRTDLALKYDYNGDWNNDPEVKENWVLECEGNPHRSWGYLDPEIHLLDTTKENSESNPYIIESAEQLFYIVKIGGSKTAGKYYKVKDGIRAFHLSAGVDDKTSFSEMVSKLSAGGTNWQAEAAFQGHFDGNGVIITGIRSVAYDSGLFPKINGDVTIKNVTVMNSYLKGTYSVGGIFGRQEYKSQDQKVYTIKVENCAVYQCYMESTHETNGVGAIGGYVSNTYSDSEGKWHNGDTIINNCYVNLDEDYFISKTETSGTGSHGGAVGFMSSATMHVNNSIFIGIRPYTARNLTGDKKANNYGWQAAKAECYYNIYTTHPCDDAYNSAGVQQDFTSRITTLNDSQFKGAAAAENMPTLSWGTVWATTDGYPAIQNATTPVSRTSNPDFTIVGTNLVYGDDGSFAINIHYIPPYADFEPTLYVGDTNCTKLHVLTTPVASSKRDEIGDNTAMMFTLKGISAKDIDKVWHPTLVATNGSTVEWSKSVEISVAETAKATLTGNYDIKDQNVAAAVLQYGDASKAALAVTTNAANAGTIDTLVYGDYLTEEGSSSKWYDSKVADDGETGLDWDNAIIIDSAEELVYLCKQAGDETKGKYYKVADGIAGFDLSGGKITDFNGTLASQLENIKNSAKNHAGNADFQGHFDGNGATVYGALINGATYAALFPRAKGDVEIKNTHVKLSYFNGTTCAAGIVGYHKAENQCTLSVENCSVTDTYLEVTGLGYGTGVGAVLGKADGYGSVDGDVYNAAYKINNCYINLDEDYFKSAAEDGIESTIPDKTEKERTCHGGIAGAIVSNAAKFTNCLVIGIKPYAVSESTTTDDAQHSALPDRFSNVYTTSDVPLKDVKIGATITRTYEAKDKQILGLADAQLKGANAVVTMGFDSSVWMADKAGYPQLANAHKKVTTTDKQDGTHTVKCACGFGDIASAHNFAGGTCVCGAKLNCANRKTIYWDGTKATSVATGTGTKDDPYIIKTAAELAYVVGMVKEDWAETADKYYKVDDSIGAIVLQSEDKAAEIMALKDAAAVKAYFEDTSKLFLEWKHYGWEGSTFCGDIDFNGVTIYGLYMKSANNAGLISNADAGTALHNVALKNSYIVSNSDAANYNVGGLVAITNGNDHARQNSGMIWFDGCVVANNYMRNNSTGAERSGVIIGSSQDAVYMDNCMTYGNDAKYGDNVDMPILATAKNNVPVSDSIVAPEGLKATLVSDGGTPTEYYYCMFRNSIFFDAKPYNTGRGTGSRLNDPKCFVNVLTDTDIANDVFSNGKKLGGIEADKTVDTEAYAAWIKTATVADLKTATLCDAWFNTDTYPELKSFHDAEFTATKVDAAKHALACSCGFAGATENHKWKSDETPATKTSTYCEVCNYVCEHTGYENKPVTGDCVTGSGYTFDCENCGFHEENIAEPDGHDFEDKAAVPATDCKSCGTIAYKYCKTCKKNYATDASKTEPFANALESISDNTYGNHNFTTVAAVAGKDCKTYGTIAHKHCATCEKDFAVDAADNEAAANALTSISDNTYGAHDYDNACDTTCNTCSAVREVPDHVYDDANDMDCNECGAPRVIEWKVDVKTSGLYTIAPNTAYTADFSTENIVVADAKTKAEVAYNAAKGGYMLVAGTEYAIKFVDNSFLANITGDLAWNTTLVADTLYSDVPANEWYNDAIVYSTSLGIMTGYGGTDKFGAADNIQRQDFVVMLARYAGVDLSVYDDVEITFRDVPAGEYYTNAILWAADAGITTGYAGGTVFGVGDIITREQLVTFLYRFATYANEGVAPAVSDEDRAEIAAQYPDYALVTDYAQDAVVWALKANVIKGQGGTHIAPAGNALRCEVAQIMYNMDH